MGKIIDADEFLYNLTHWFDQHGIEHEMTSGLFNIVVIEGAIKITKESKPTVDAAKHGEWIEAYGMEEAMKGTVICSNCRESYSAIVLTSGEISLRNQKTKFCPNCGAKMDGKEQDDESRENMG